MISNTDRSGKWGTHWSSIINIYPKNVIFLSDSLGIIDLRNIIIQNNEKISQEKRPHNRKTNQTDRKVKIVETNFSRSIYDCLEVKEIAILDNTPKDVFNFIDVLGKLHNACGSVEVNMLGNFSCYPRKNIKMIADKNLSQNLTFILFCLHVLIVLRTRFRVDPHSIVAWMSRNSLIETDAITEL